jgi:glycosyltransferase involved in cell wall biosynthesis
VVLGNVENPNAYVRALLAKRGDRVRFLGTIYDREKLAALRFFARSYFHGHSVGGTNPSLLEAMACSNLVIAHDNPFNREVLGDSGIFFRTSAELASAVDAIDAGRVDIRMLQRGATDRTRTRYQWDRIADAYLELF